MAYFDGGGTRACSVWHRRGGKDTAAIHQTAKMAHVRRGLYWHMLPTQRQARKVVWDAFTRNGDRLIDEALPPALRKGEPNNTEMKMQLRCGSMYQLVGSDNYDALVGANPIGVVFSEWSLTDPRVWDYIRPILLENGGWAWFIYTPRGYNHGWDIKNIAESSDEWHYSCQTVDDTGILTPEDIERERRDGMPEELIQQEFYCSFSSANVGAILGSLVEEAEREGRLVDTDDLYDKDGAPVFVSMDIGFRDTTAAWYWQVKPDGVSLLKYEEETGLDADDWVAKLHESEFPVTDVWLPHDAKAKTFSTKNSALERFLKGGFKTVRLVPKSLVSDRINAARAVMKYGRFQRARTQRGLMSLREWQFTWNDKTKIFSKDPQHNWASHGSDSFSYGAQVVLHHINDWAGKLAKHGNTSRIILPRQAMGNNYAFHLEQLHSDREEDMSRILRI